VDITVTEISPEQARTLLGIDENHFIDLKGLDVSPANITKAVSGFANTSGGEIYVGVDESIGSKGLERTWRGFSNVEAANGLLQAIEGMAPLAGHYEATFLTADGMSGLVLHVTLSKTRDVINASNGKAYIRRGAQSLPIEGDEVLQRLKYDKGISSFEDQLVDADPATITNSEGIIDFLLQVVPTAEPEVWLEKQRLLVKRRPTVAGILLSAFAVTNRTRRRCSTTKATIGES